MNPRPQQPTPAPSLIHAMRPAVAAPRPAPVLDPAPASHGHGVVAAPPAAKKIPLGVRIGAGLLVALGAWSLLAPAGPDDQHRNFKTHQDITAGVAQSPSPVVTASRAATKAALAAIPQGQPADLATILKAVEVDMPANLQPVLGGGRMLPAMPPRAQQQLAQQIARGDAQFYEMMFYDHCAEDGDWIVVQLDNGLSYGPFMITHRGTTIRVPGSPGRPPAIRIVGHIDGGGGITVAAKTGGGNWFSGVMQPGQSELMAYTIQ